MTENALSAPQEIVIPCRSVVPPLARKSEKETGEAPILAPDIADDVAEIIRNRKPWTPTAWN
jgi:hypothetical protein